MRVPASEPAATAAIELSATTPRAHQAARESFTSLNMPRARSCYKKTPLQVQRKGRRLSQRRHRNARVLDLAAPIDFERATGSFRPHLLWTKRSAAGKARF